jgi:hypothetical protein
MSTSKMRVGLLIGAGIGLLAIVGLGVAVLLLSGEEETTPKPTRRPDTGFFVTQGPFITVQTTTPTDTVLGTGQIINIRAEDVVGIRSIQIRHRNELVGEPDFRAGQHTVYVSYPWIPETAGEHEFRVTAITSDGRSGDRTFILESDCCPPPTDVLLNYEVEPGENLPTIAAKFGLCLEELTSANPTIRKTVKRCRLPLIFHAKTVSTRLMVGVSRAALAVPSFSPAIAGRIVLKINPGSIPAWIFHLKRASR